MLRTKTDLLELVLIEGRCTLGWGDPILALRLRSCVPGFSAEVPKGGVEFINFPFAPFGSEICSEQPWPRAGRIRGQIQKGQTGSTRTQESQESRNLISDPNSWPYDPNMHFYI